MLSECVVRILFQIRTPGRSNLGFAALGITKKFFRFTKYLFRLHFTTQNVHSLLSEKNKVSTTENSYPSPSPYAHSGKLFIYSVMYVHLILESKRI